MSEQNYCFRVEIPLVIFTYDNKLEYKIVVDHGSNLLPSVQLTHDMTSEENRLKRLKEKVSEYASINTLQYGFDCYINASPAIFCDDVIYLPHGLTVHNSLVINKDTICDLNDFSTNCDETTRKVIYLMTGYLCG